MKFLKTFILTRWLFSYCCKKCGSDYKKLSLGDLPQDVVEKHVMARTAWLIKAYAYQCTNRCEGSDKAVLIV